MKAFVGVTDNDWYDFLSREPELDEVNFWQPGGKTQFKALELGQPFLFKLKAPRNVIAGGGFFSYSSIMPLGLAWAAFERKNGTATFEELARLIGSKKGGKVGYGDHIGCIMLRDPFFFDQRDWFPAPDFPQAVVVGKGFDLTTSVGQVLWREVEQRLPRARGMRPRVAEPMGPTLGGYGLSRRRLGQGVFCARITDLYGRRCAVTREKALPVLQAAHIRPIHKGGEHRLDNGLLLRSDVHRLFDDGYVTITPKYEFRVSDELRKEFDDGETYRPFKGHRIWTPEEAAFRPSSEFLEWHNDEIFLG